MEDDYADVFDDSLGTLPGVQHLEVDPSVKPVVVANRRIPISILPELKTKSDRLVEKGVITSVNEPTPWVNKIVITKKKQGLRICIHPPELNKALKRVHYTLPVLEVVLHELGQLVYCLLQNRSSGFLHVQLDEESSLLTTFHTCFGHNRWLRPHLAFQFHRRSFRRSC